MRNRLRFQPDPFDYSLLARIHTRGGGDGPAWPESGASISKLAGTLAVGEGASSTDLALDLVLHEIAEQVRLATGATGVAIALTRAGELVCRATTGSAPELGLRLDPYSGLSGFCLQTKLVQRCNDTEMDSRVDSAACRNLRVRSILVAPVRMINNSDIVGLLEAFSADPDHFTDADTETLVSFCTRIVHTIDSAAESAALYKQTVPGIENNRAPSSNSNRVAPRPRLSDRWSVLLTTAIVAVALILGWMIGLADKHRVAIRNPASLSVRTRPTPQQQRIGNQNAPTSAARAETSEPPANQPKTPATDLPEFKSRQGQNDSGGLVVYQNGKVVFREAPHSRADSGKRQSRSSKPAIVSPPIPAAIIPAAKTDLLAPGDADQYVTYRAQPQYPELARKQHIQGPVLLKVLVGKDGSVQQVQVISGDPKLASAAADAVVKWRFKQFLLSGQPAEFQTQVTVDFKLP